MMEPILVYITPNIKRKKRAMNSPLILNLSIFVLLLTICISANAENIAQEEEDWRIPPGQLFDIGGYKLHMYCLGEGSPTVIFDSGIGGFSLEWIHVERLLEKQVKACAYDRAGYGWSEPGPSPRTTEHIVDELHKLLEVAGITPPYVLAGHSFGGYNMQYYAKAYPDEISGLVLVESSHPQQADLLPDLPARREKSKTSQTVTYFYGQSTFEYYPEDVRYKLMRILSLDKNYSTYRRESINFAISGNQVVRAGPLPDIPLIVITRGKRVWPENPYGNMLEYTWFEMQKDLARMTSSGRQIIATNSDHLIHLEEPDVVASAIMSIVEEARQHKDK